MSKFTAQHFPKGTIVSTNLYTTDEESHKFMRFGTDKPTTFTVDHIRVADTWSGRIHLLVTTTKKKEPLFEGDDFITFNIDHVDRIVKLGTVTDIRYNESQNKWGLDEGTGNKLNELALKQRLLNMFNKLQPHNQYDIVKAEKAVVACGCVKKVEYVSWRNIQRITYVINKKKLKVWVKRNINRFIFTQKEIAEQERLADIELNRDLEDAISFDMSLDIDDEFPKHKHYGDDDYYLTQPDYY